MDRCSLSLIVTRRARGADPCGPRASVPLKKHKPFEPNCHNQTTWKLCNDNVNFCSAFYGWLCFIFPACLSRFQLCRHRSASHLKCRPNGRLQLNASHRLKELRNTGYQMDYGCCYFPIPPSKRSRLTSLISSARDTKTMVRPGWPTCSNT